MAITITNLRANHRGIYFEFTGDGATTVLPAITPSQLPVRIRPNSTVTATCVSSPTGQYDRGASNSTGLHALRTGTPVSISSATVSASAGIVVTTSAAVGNGVSAACECVFSTPMN